MAFYDSYRPVEYSRTFDVPDGDWKLTIKEAKAVQSKTGKGMIEVTLAVQGSDIPYTERYVEGEYFDRNMTRFFDAFSIRRGDFDFSSWRRRTGTGHFVHREETYTTSSGETRTANRARLQYLATPEVPAAFPEDIPWDNGGGGLSPAEEAGAAAAFDGGSPMKGDPSSPEEKNRIGQLLRAKYANGVQVFSAEEVSLYSTYRKEKFTAAELIAFIEHALRNRRPDAPELGFRNEIDF